MTRLAAFVSALLLVAPIASAQVGEPAGELVINDSFLIDEIEAIGGLPDIGIAIGFTQQQGRIVVCAATASQLSGTLSQIKRSLIITEGGTRVMRGLHWSPNYPAGSDLLGRTAECQITRFPAPAEPEFGISLERTRF